jgi:hypothetical protein
VTHHAHVPRQLQWTIKQKTLLKIILIGVIGAVIFVIGVVIFILFIIVIFFIFFPFLRVPNFLYVGIDCKSIISSAALCTAWAAMLLQAFCKGLGALFVARIMVPSLKTPCLVHGIVQCAAERMGDE